jgi:hypothetical protein
MKWVFISIGAFIDGLKLMIMVSFFALQFFVPFALSIGIVLDTVISILFGTALIILLLINGMWYPLYFAAAFFGGIIPFIDILPGWTGLAWACTSQKEKDEKKKLEERQANEEEPGEEPVQPIVSPYIVRQRFDGIRAADNDNFESEPEKIAA